VRVLDLTRVLAGPTCGRTLAEHGADVLRVGAERLPSIEPFVVDTGRGKRNAFLDLDRPADLERLRDLAARGDVFCQGYRPGALEARGLGPEALAELRPGTVYVSIDCYGHGGPWSGRRGWEQLAQSAVGIAHGEGGEGLPRLAPAAATDYTTGALAAYGALEALARRATEGGSWHVRASLCQTGMWLTRLGPRLDAEAATGLGDPADLQIRSDTVWGPLTHLAPALTMERTPPRASLPPAPLGHHAPEWLPRSTRA
jgi:crotonobetainyl-CoA:carnitine CoA-transferase CaiB-like acyl-CoA transferase